MSREMIYRLLLPLLGIFLGSSALAWWIAGRFDANGFLINIGTDALAIAATVFYVDWVLRVHREKSWERVKGILDVRLKNFLGYTVSKFITPMGLIRPEYDKLPAPEGGDLAALHRYFVEQLRRVVASRDLEEYALAIPDDRMPEIIASLRDTLSELDSLLDAPGPEMKPHVLSALLVLRQAISAMLSFHSIVKGGLEGSGARKRRRKPRLAMALLGASIAQPLRRMCAAVLALHDAAAGGAY